MFFGYLEKEAYDYLLIIADRQLFQDGETCYLTATLRQDILPIGTINERGPIRHACIIGISQRSSISSDRETLTICTLPLVLRIAAVVREERTRFLVPYPVVPLFRRLLYFVMISYRFLRRVFMIHHNISQISRIIDLLLSCRSSMTYIGVVVSFRYTSYRKSP